MNIEWHNPGGKLHFRKIINALHRHLNTIYWSKSHHIRLCIGFYKIQIIIQISYVWCAFSICG